MNDNKILIVDDDAVLLEDCKVGLGSLYSLDVAMSGEEGLKAIKKNGPYVVVIADINMNGMNGIEFLSIVSEMDPDTIRIIITGNANLDFAMDAINKGNIFRFLTKPVTHEDLISIIDDSIRQYKLTTLERQLNKQLWDEIKRRNEVETQLKEVNLQLGKLARSDSLTGLMNRRTFMEKLQSEFERSRRYKNPLSLIMLDIDDFKGVNDVYGHVAGDRVLKFVADQIKDCMRTTDYSGRYGGEEFCAILTNTALEGASKIAERLRQSISEREFTGNDDVFTITCTIGLAQFDKDLKTIEEFVNKADEALYRGKRGGKNKVVSNLKR